MAAVGLRDVRMPFLRRPEPGEDFEEVALPSQVDRGSLDPPPQPRRAPGDSVSPLHNPGLRRASETFLRKGPGPGFGPASSPRTSAAPLASAGSPKRQEQGAAFTKIFSMHRDRLSRVSTDSAEALDSPSGQALAAMVERLHDEEVRKREERKAARTFAREKEISRQAPFAPKLSAASRCASEPGERHHRLYDHRLEMAKRRREQQEQRLREEREYCEAHSVHRAKSPQAKLAVYQRLHEDAELKRQRRSQFAEEKARSPARRVASERQLKLYELAQEAAERRRALQNEKLEEEQRYLKANSVHRAKSPQDPAVVSQRLHEEAKLKRMRILELQREQELKEKELTADALRKRLPSRKDEEALVQRLFRPERRNRQHLREEEEEWLRERRRLSIPQRSASLHSARFASQLSTPAESPKAYSEATPSSSPMTMQTSFLQALPGDLPGEMKDFEAENVNAAFDSFLVREEPATPASEDPSANAEEPSPAPEEGGGASQERRRISLELEECF